MSRVDKAMRRASGAPQNAPTDEVFASSWAPAEAQAEPSHPVPDPPSLSADGSAPVGHLAGDSEWVERLVVSDNPDPLLSQQFRRAAAGLHEAQSGQGTKVVLVTSADEGEGKTLTAVNLALILADSYRRRVLLIDADLRKPAIHEMWHLPRRPGLGDSLRDDGAILGLTQLAEYLWFLPAGTHEADPVSCLSSPRLAQLVEEARTQFDWVIIDSAPILPVADTRLLAPVVDTGVFVVRAARSRYESVREAVDIIGRDKVLGVVLNGTSRAELPSYQRYYYQQPGDGGGSKS